jgi:hypothetical protein
MIRRNKDNTYDRFCAPASPQEDGLGCLPISWDAWKALGSEPRLPGRLSEQSMQAMLEAITITRAPELESEHF